ncbi:MAG: hypothetical protein ACTSWL_03145 [Promethearchaeota archaeon]
MGRTCNICGSFVSDNKQLQLNREIKEIIASYGVALMDELDSSSQILCENCGKPFCPDCFQKKVYNGKSLSSYSRIFDKKYGTLETRSFVSSKYLCEKCASLNVATHCSTCGKELGDDKEDDFSGRHIGFHVKCTKCGSSICLDCATQPKNPLKWKKKCPFCGKSKWLPTKADLLLKYYSKNIIYLNSSHGIKCTLCGKEKSVILYCNEKKYQAPICPDCLMEFTSKELGNCPICGKMGFSKFKKMIPDLSKECVELVEQKKFEDKFLTPADSKQESSDTTLRISQDNEPQNEAEISGNPEFINDIYSDSPVPDDSILNAMDQAAGFNESDESLKIHNFPAPNDIQTDKIKNENNNEPCDLADDLKRFVRICNLIDDLQEMIRGMNYNIQLNMKNGNHFYIRVLNNKIHGHIGKLSNPNIYSELLTDYEAQSLLQGKPDFDFETLHGDIDLIGNLMDLIEMFEMIVNA